MIAVLDLGKTLTKLTLWEAGGAPVERRTRPNARAAGPGYAALDVEGIEAWLVETLTHVAARGPVEAIIPVGHGAAAAVVRDGRLVLPPLDYEQSIPADVMRRYRRERDPFAITGSPALPDGLNLGSQLFWLETLEPGLFTGATILPWPQYWAWRLSGVATTEVTSLGCHTDLWEPAAADFSPLARRLGWADAFAPLARAGDAIGTLSPEWARLTGLHTSVRVHCGIHDSNAALVATRGHPELARTDATVLSTGTWFVAMRSPLGPVDLAALPSGRDCLVNVDAGGAPVPSARFMGGREIEILVGLDAHRIDITPDQPALLAAVPAILAREVSLLPTFAPGFGPFPTSAGRWINEPDDWIERRAAVSLYAALVADVALDLIGARDRIVVEGRFAAAEVFVRALARLRPNDRVCTSPAHDDVSLGALRLIDPSRRPAGPLVPVAPLAAKLDACHAAWRRAAVAAEVCA